MTKTGRARQIFKPEFQFGLGGVPLGNEFEVVTEEGARETLEASWTAGVRYFDVSPWYGLGLAERRYGAFLHQQPRDSYLISTKVGKLLKASPHSNSKELFPYANSPNNVVFDIRQMASDARSKTACSGSASIKLMLCSFTTSPQPELKRQNLIQQNAPVPEGGA